MAQRRTVTRPRTVLGTVVAVAAAVLIWWFTDGGDGGDTTARSESSVVTVSPSESSISTVSPATVSPSESSISTVSPATTDRPSIDGLDAIDAADLPPEARDTLDLIDEGGPFPYDQDGATFQNREGILPDRPSGYYEEYTVETPGSDDRGARRIVTGDEGETYYTDDHYDSFRRVLR